MLSEYFVLLYSFICIQGMITGVLLWKLHKREAVREKREEARKQNDFFLIKGLGAAIALGEATAKAVQRLDLNCNGEMTRALEEARETKHAQKEFLQRQGIANLQKG